MVYIVVTTNVVCYVVVYLCATWHWNYIYICEGVLNILRLIY
jgi:hypothetical protein